MDVPISYGAWAGQLSGHFEYRPPLGTFSSELSTREPAPGVSLIPLPGNPTPGVALKNTSGAPVEVLGAAGEPFLRIGPNAVLANLRSPDWASQSPESDPGTPPPDASAAPDWVVVGTGSEYAFVLPGRIPRRAGWPSCTRSTRPRRCRAGRCRC